MPFFNIKCVYCGAEPNQRCVRVRNEKPTDIPLKTLMHQERGYIMRAKTLKEVLES